MVDRRELKREIEEHRANIERRQAELDCSHEAIMDDTRRTLERARPVIYSQPVFTPAVKQSEQSSPDDFWIDVMAEALSETRIDLRSEFSAMVEKAQAPLREHIARLEGQLAMLLTLLGDKPARGRTRAIPAAKQLRLVKPNERVS